MLFKENPSIFLNNNKPGSTFQKVVATAKTRYKKMRAKSLFESGLSQEDEKPYSFHKGKLARLKYKVKLRFLLYFKFYLIISKGNQMDFYLKIHFSLKFL